ncbi:hypothetical protein CPB86DRAFT_842051 [Serendipita vermifera]|nr:hypothetical protein CPB86DRAFT_842051 [Serendipita vermifera]
MGAAVHLSTLNDALVWINKHMLEMPLDVGVQGRLEDTATYSTLALPLDRPNGVLPSRLPKNMKDIIIGLQGLLRLSKFSREHRVPTLPLEIWFIILELAICPNIIVDAEFEPHQIEVLHDYLTWHANDNQLAAVRMAYRARDRLRAVCSLWKNIVEEIKIKPLVLEFSHSWWDQKLHEIRFDSSIFNPAMDTRVYSRMNLLCTVDIYSRIQVRQTHPISVLSLTISAEEPAHACITGIGDVISFPEDLKVFNLSLEGHTLPVNFLKEMELKLSSLTTLGVSLEGRMLDTAIELPHLVTLRIGIISSAPSNLTPLRDIRWTLPALRHLLLEDTGLDTKFRKTNVFFFGLLQDYLALIRTLSLEPMTEEVVDVNSPICWMKMSQLGTLATDFYLPRPMHPKYGNRLFGPHSTSVRYLVQTHYVSCTEFSQIYKDNIYIWRKAFGDHRVKLLDEDGVEMRLEESDTP